MDFTHIEVRWDGNELIIYIYKMAKTGAKGDIDDGEYIHASIKVKEMKDVAEFFKCF